MLATPRDDITRREAPSGFRPAENVWSVELCEKPVKDEERKSAAQKSGLRYEKKAIKAIFPLFKGCDAYVGPWIKFKSDGMNGGKEIRFASPDLLILTPGPAIVFEMKAVHTEVAWWQLIRLYKPLVQFLFEKPVRCVEVTKSYDPAVPMPAVFDLVFSFEEMMERLHAPAFVEPLVVQWRP